MMEGNEEVRVKLGQALIIRWVGQEALGLDVMMGVVVGSAQKQVGFGFGREVKKLWVAIRLGQE